MKTIPAPSAVTEVVATSMEEDRVIDLVPQLLHLKNILVPIDFSALSLKALQYAVPFATQFGAKLTLINVVEPPLLPPDAPVLGNLEEVAITAREHQLDELARGRVPTGIEWRTIVRSGFPYDDIVAVARDTQADLIILTTHGYTGFKHAVLGSTAEHVVRKAPCPVLVVRDREHEFV